MQSLVFAQKCDGPATVMTGNAEILDTFERSYLEFQLSANMLAIVVFLNVTKMLPMNVILLLAHSHTRDYPPSSATVTSSNFYKKLQVENKHILTTMLMTLKSFFNPCPTKTMPLSIRCNSFR